MISELMSDDIPPQIKILSMVIQIQMNYKHVDLEKKVKT